jgi:AraC-like DNA-binding protein
MLYCTYIPTPLLADFVDSFWYHEGFDLPHKRERVLPTGAMELVINLRDDTLKVYDPQQPDLLHRLHPSLVCGAWSEPFSVATAWQSSLIGVNFKPGGARPFFRLPANVLHNTHLSLAELLGTAAHHLREQLFEAATAERRFKILERFLLAQANLQFTPHAAVTYALRAFQQVPHTQTILEVSQQTGFSQKRFIQLFSEAVGLTPKLYCRVRRFQTVICVINRSVQDDSPPDWAGLALACGYYDQAHFIRDFQAFSGFTPTAYLTRRGDSSQHLPL